MHFFFTLDLRSPWTRVSFVECIPCSRVSLFPIPVLEQLMVRFFRFNRILTEFTNLDYNERKFLWHHQRYLQNSDILGINFYAYRFEIILKQYIVTDT